MQTRHGQQHYIHLHAGLITKQGGNHLYATFMGSHPAGGNTIVTEEASYTALSTTTIQTSSLYYWISTTVTMSMNLVDLMDKEIAS